jgi:hypothetical protein
MKLLQQCFLNNIASKPVVASKLSAMKNDNLIVNYTRFHFLEMPRLELETLEVEENPRIH